MPPSLSDEASRVPVLIKELLDPLATSLITPPLFSILAAPIMPLLFTTLVKISLAALPFNKTLPPSALIVPVLDTASSRSCTFCKISSSTVNCIKPSPSKSIVTFLPATKFTCPAVAMIVPSFLTAPPIKVTEPPVAACMSPWLTTKPPSEPSVLKNW